MSDIDHIDQSNKDQKRQQGVALFTVLIMLLILASATAALVQSQRWSVRQTADRLSVFEQNALSTSTHDLCVEKLRTELESNNALMSVIGYPGQIEFATKDDTRWDQDGCLFEWYEIPADTNVAWQPHIRISSRATNSSILEISEWRYPACLEGQVCVEKLKHLEFNELVYDVKYGSGQIEMTRQRL